MSGDEGSSLLMSDEERSALGESFVAPGDRERTLSWHRCAAFSGSGSLSLPLSLRPPSCLTMSLLA